MKICWKLHNSRNVWVEGELSRESRRRTIYWVEGELLTTLPVLQLVPIITFIA